MTNSFIYILSLDDEALYVGITKNLKKRIEQHQTGKGSEFTKLYTYGKIEKVFDIELNSDEYDDDAVKFLETQITFGLMNSFGYNNVRGGEFKTSRKYNKNPCLLKKNLAKWPIEAVEDQINDIIDELKNHPIIDVYLSYQLEKINL
jgi:hypothetical protein